MVGQLNEATYLAAAGARITAAPDGSLAALIERQRVVVVELQRATVIAEIGLEAEDTDVVWVGAPPRLLVLSRGAQHSTAYLIDPIGPRSLTQIRIETAMRITAAVGQYALAIGTRNAAVLMAGEASLTPYQFPARALPIAAGAAPRQFVVAVAGAIEEWDPQQRIPKRRLRLPRAATITALGGTDKLVWLTTQQDPARVEVLLLVNTGQPMAHELPEPIAEVSSQPHRDTLVCRGVSGRLYTVDLEGRAAIAAIEPPSFDRVDAAALYAGRTTGVIAARAHHPLALLGVDGRALVPVPPVETVRSPDKAAAPPAAVASAAAEPSNGAALDGDGAAARPRWTADAERPVVQLLGSLAPRAAYSRCSPTQYQDLLEAYRTFAAAIATRAIAQDWDNGRIAYPTHDRPPFEAEVFGIAGRRSGLAAKQLAEATEALDAAKRALDAAKGALDGRISPFGLMLSEHGVTRLGELVLLLVAAPTLWGELARVYGILANDASRPLCDEHLLWQLLAPFTSRREIAAELEPEAPLLRYGLLRAAPGRARPFQALFVDPVAAKLLGGSPIDVDRDAGMAAVPATVSLEGVLAPRDVIQHALDELAMAPPGLGRLVVRGQAGSGRRTLLAALARQASRTLATIDIALLLREKRIASLRELLQHAHLGGWLPCLDGLDTIGSDDPGARATVRELIRDHNGPIAVRLPRHAQPPLEPGYVLIDLPPSTIAERATQWRDALAPHKLAVRNPDELAARFTVGPGTIRTISDTVARAAPEAVDAAIESTMRQHLETRLGTVASRVTRLATWSQVVLPADIRDSILELVARVRHRRTVFDTWGFDQVLTSARGLTALFQGGPGTGKTLVASAIAADLGLDLYRIDLSRVISKWIGETEQNLAKVFDAAEEGHAVILFDEADSLFSKRTEVRTSVDRYANLEVNFLLQRLDSFEGVAILTTNFGTAIDAAFKRRLSCRLTFPFPDEEARERLWQVHLPKQMPRAGHLDLAGIARRYQMSGGYIRNAALRAAFLAAEEHSALTHEHLERAIRTEFREGGKLGESGQLE